MLAGAGVHLVPAPILTAPRLEEQARFLAAAPAPAAAAALAAAHGRLDVIAVLPDLGSPKQLYSS